jgi:hypothetical protein
MQESESPGSSLRGPGVRQWYWWPVNSMFAQIGCAVNATLVSGREEGGGIEPQWLMDHSLA